MVVTYGNHYCKTNPGPPACTVCVWVLVSFFMMCCFKIVVILTIQRCDIAHVRTIAENNDFYIPENRE